MNAAYDYRKFALMYVDDEPQTVSNFEAYFSDTFDVVVATSGEEAWQIFSQNMDRFAIVMTDQRMPQSTGVQLLEKVRAVRPRVLRILATAYSDLDAAIAAVNTGAIYKYVTKPWDPPFMEILLKRGMEFFLLQRELDLLLREKMAAAQRLITTDRLLNLGLFSARLNQHLQNTLPAVKSFLEIPAFRSQTENPDIEQLRSPDYWRHFYDASLSQMESVENLLQGIHPLPLSPGIPLSDRVSLAEVIRGLVEEKRPALEAKNIQVNCACEEAPEIQGHRGLLSKAFELLLEEELANLAPGSSLSIKLAQSQNPSGQPGLALELTDNGPGISASNLQCLFDPFIAKKNGASPGYGQNLLACFLAVYHHGGTVSVAENPGGGSRFSIFLPTEPQASQSGQAQAYLEHVFGMESAWEQMLITP
jgi:signal transduction histidine kinase